MKTRSLLIAAVILLAGAAAWNMSATPDQPAASAGAPLMKVSVPTLSPSVEAGKAVFDANCAACHGANAAGKDGAGPPLVHKIYEPNHHGDMAFFLAARNGARAHHWPFGDMPPVEGISENDIGKVVSYVRELQRANGIF